MNTCEVTYMSNSDNFGKCPHGINHECNRANCKMRVRIEPRESVKWFAEQMELQLRKHDDRPGWKNEPLGYLWRRGDEEWCELHKEVHQFLFGLPAQDKEKLIKEAADVANFMMMIADNHREVKNEA